ncbi:hypothetical protein PC128_g24076 [Phytophthora cactorum]|nr:hypothetical protein PC128_g24076 [Phytophthora cactorum]
MVMSYVFNSSSSMKKDRRPAEPVAKTRVDTKRDRRHFTRLTPKRAANYKLHFEPIISSDTISTHRAHFHFDCTSFMNTDWLCSPVLATMSQRNQFDSGEVE